MKSLIFLVALIGFALAFEPGHEYHYAYEGRLALGIPGIRSTVSGTGLRSTVILQFTTETKATMKLTEIKVGDFFGDIKCEMHSPMPIRYSSISGHAMELEEPFEVNFSNREGQVMTVPKSDLEWMTNIRKAVSLMFATEYFLPNGRSKMMRSQNDNKDVIDTATLPSLHGECETDVTLMPIDDPEERRELKRHVRGIEKSLEKKHDTDVMHSMITSTNFDKCSLRVELFRAGLANISLATHGQFADVTSRTSSMNFTMLGEIGKPVVLRGRQRGFVTANPMGARTDKLASVSNQTVDLLSMNKISKRFVLDGPTKDIDHWYMELASPFAPPSEPVKFINYYSVDDAEYQPLLPENIATGIKLTDDQIKGFSQRLDELLNEVAERLEKVGSVPSGTISPWNTNEGEITSYLHEANKVIKGVNMEQLQELFDRYHGDSSAKGKLKLILFIEVAAACGNGATMKVLLNNIEKGNISKTRIASIFTTLPNHFTYAPVVNDIIQYVKTLDLKENPFLTTLVYVNVAKVLNRVCVRVDHAKFSSHFDVFGAKQCDADRVATQFVDILSRKFDDSQSSWERMVIVESLGNLGTRFAMEKLQDIILGDFDITVKRVAIYALVSEKMEQGERDSVFDCLMAVVDDHHFDPYLRQISMTTLMTWHPPASWWQRLAMRSWNETSVHVGAYFYQVVKDLSSTSQLRYENASKICQFVLPMTKPYARSPFYTYAHIYGFRDEHEYLGADYNHAVLRDDRSPYPLETYHSIWHNLGGIQFTLIEGGISSDLPNERMRDDTSDLIKSLLGDKMNKDMDELLKQVESSLSRHGLMNKMNLFIRLFNNMEFLAPVNKDTIKHAFGKGGIDLLRKWMTGAEVHLTKFLDPASFEILLPTECGFPFLVRANSPIIQGAEGHTQLRVKGHPTIPDLLKLKDIKVDLTTNYKLATKLIVTFGGLAPWSQKVVAAGVESFKGVNFPGKNTFGIQHLGEVKNLTYQFTPTSADHEYPSHHFHTVPFVLRKSMWPGEDHKNYEKFAALFLRDDKQGVTKRTIPISYPHFGIKGEIQFEGDTPFPYTYGNFMEYFHTNPALLGQLLSSPSVRISSSYIGVDFGKSEMKTFHSSFAMTKPLSYEKSRLWNANALFEGSNSRYYEVSGTHDEESDGLSTASVEVARNSVPKYNLDARCYCFNLTTTSPVFNDYRSLLNVLESENMEVDYNGILNGGKSCHEQKFASVKGKLTISSIRKKLLAKELEDDCDYDPRNPMAGFRTAPVYDKIDLGIDYATDKMPNYVKNVSYHMYDMARGMAYPHVVFNYIGVNNQDGRIAFRGDRHIDDKRWNLRVEMPTENVQFERFRVPPAIDRIIPFFGIFPHMSYRHLGSSKLIMNSELNKKCILTKDSVKTFDGKRYSYSSEPCPTTSVMNKYDREDVLLRTDISVDGKMEAEIGSPKIGMTITFSTELFSVNGKHLKLSPSKHVIKSFRNAYFAEARKVDDYIEVLVPGNFSVKLWDDKVEVTPAGNMRSKYLGMCGNYNGEPSDDLVGPKNCRYTDTELFAKAWTEYSNVGCDYRHNKEEKEEVERFQKHCPKSGSYRNSHHQMPITKVLSKEPRHNVKSEEKCTEYVYYIKTRFGNICVAQDSVAKCKEGCKTEKRTIAMEVYDCWSEDTTPEILRKNLERGYLKEKVNITPTVTTSFRTPNAFICE